MRTKLLLFIVIAAMVFFCNIHPALCVGKPAAAATMRFPMMPNLPGQPPPPRLADRSSVDRAPLYNVNIHSDTSTFTQVPASFTNFSSGEAVWVDYDNDGRLDVLAAGWTDTIFATKIYHNDGDGQFTDIGADLPGRGTFRGIAWGDYDNDGDVDLAISGSMDWIGTGRAATIYRNDNGVFTDIHAPLDSLNFGSMNWVDYDQDGQLDLFVTGSTDQGITFTAKIYRNDNGTFSEVPNTGLVGVWGSCSAWADYDNDGYPDLLLMGWAGYDLTTIYHNNSGESLSEGMPLFTDISPPFVPIVHGSAAWVDFNNDGLMDVSIEGTTYGYESVTKLYRNMGGGAFEEYNAGITPLGVGAMAWGDYDNDGWMDFAIQGGSNWWGENPATKIYRNDHGTFVDIGADLPAAWGGSLAWGDFDNDGKLDLIMTGNRAPNYTMPPVNPLQTITVLFRNNVSTVNTRPTVPPPLSAVSAGQNVQLRWNAASDVETPANGITYNLRIGRAPGGIDIVAPNSITGTGFRRMPKSGNTGYKKTFSLKNLPAGRYYWSVQAVDNEYAGSPFSTEQSFEIGGNTPRWQLVSTAYIYADARTATLYPAAISPAYAYGGSAGYQVQQTLENGKGYWLKFPTSSLPASLSGAALPLLSIPVEEGWNLIGSVSAVVPISSIGCSAPGMTASSFYSYNGQYAASNVIEPGLGYWVKVNQAGILTLSTAGIAPGAAALRIVPGGEMPPSPPDQTMETGSTQPKEFSLGQNYPNPFNPTTDFGYRIADAGHVTLKVFDVLGQEVALLVDEVKAPGEYHVRWNAAGMASGVYLYRLSANGSIQTRSMLLTK